MGYNGSAGYANYGISEFSDFESMRGTTYIFEADIRMDNPQSDFAGLGWFVGGTAAVASPKNRPTLVVASRYDQTVITKSRSHNFCGCRLGSD